METFSELLAICAGNSPVTGEFPAQRPVTRRLDVFFDLRLNKRNKRLSKQSRRRWFETQSGSLGRHSTVANTITEDAVASYLFISLYKIVSLLTPFEQQSIKLYIVINS